VKDEKLIRKFLTDQRHIILEDCKRILESYGYVLHKSSGSHRIFHQKGFISITIVVPKGTKYIKSPYVKQIIKELKMESEYGQ
jgi:predicted RNA binding protein YcfA (HicA-like mRNA interferase family)